MMIQMIRTITIWMMLCSSAFAGGLLSDIFPLATTTPTPVVTPTPDPAIKNIMTILQCLQFPPGTYVIVITPQTPVPTIIKHGKGVLSCLK